MNNNNYKRKRTTVNLRGKNGGNRRSYGRLATKRKPGFEMTPELLTQKAVARSMDAFIAQKSFKEWPLHPTVQNNLKEKGYCNPTEIQEKAFQYLVNGRDLVGIANTGTGKTGAFLLPIIERIIKNPFKTLIVVPTRELALQVEQEFLGFSRGAGIHCLSLVGGTSVTRDISKLRMSHHLVVGTPGRLLDMVNRGALKLSDFSVLVLDEFDRMLDMGFVNDVRKMVAMMPNRRQTMLFSATSDKSQNSLINKLLSNPVEIRVNDGTSTANLVDQDVIRVPKDHDKFSVLLKLIADEEFEKVLLFVETKRLVNKVSKKLQHSGVRVEHIHGNKTQNYRKKALNRFKDGSIQVLVATDVVARGIDITDITHVINYQIPQSLDSYIHRIGRTGRAGKKGKAFTFID